MELTAVYRCVAALDVHQAKLTVCILYENALGEVPPKCASLVVSNGIGAKWQRG